MEKIKEILEGKGRNEILEKYQNFTSKNTVHSEDWRVCCVFDEFGTAQRLYTVFIDYTPKPVQEDPVVKAHNDSLPEIEAHYKVGDVVVTKPDVSPDANMPPDFITEIVRISTETTAEYPYYLKNPEDETAVKASEIRFATANEKKRYAGNHNEPIKSNDW